MATLFFNVEADYTKVLQLNQQIQRLQNTMRSFNAKTPIQEIRAVEEEMAKCQKEAQSLLIAAAQMGTQFQSKLQGNIKNTSNNMRDLSVTIRETGSAFSGINQSIGGFIRQFSAAALAVKGLQTSLNLIKGAMNTIVDFEASGSVLQAVTGFSESSEEFTSMRDKALELGRATRYTASQVTDLEISLAKLGFVPDDINAMSQSILQFGLATGASLDDAATITGAALRMFGADAEEATRYTSAMSAAINKTALNFQAVSDNLATFGPVAKTVGLNIEQSLAIFGKLKDLGYEGSTAATSVRNILNEMSSGKLSKALGYEVDSFEKFIQALKDLGGQGFGDGTEKAMKAVGKRGGAQLIALVQNAEEVEKKYKEIAEMSASTDGMDELATKMNTNVKGAIAVVQSAWQDLVLQFSNATGPIAEVLGSISNGLNVISDAISGKESDNTFLGMDGETLLGITEALGGLIATIATYKAMMAGMDKFNSFFDGMKNALGAEQAQRYQEMAQALTDFTGKEEVMLDAQSKELVQNGVLTEQQAALVQELRNKAQAEVADLDAKLASLNADKLVIESSVMKAELQMKEAQGEWRLAQATYGAAAAKGDLAAQEKLNIAQKKIDIAQTNLQAGRELMAANAKEISAVASRKEAIANGIDTAAKKANVAATTELKMAMDALGLSLLTNPYFLLAAAIVGVGVATYKLVSAFGKHEEAQTSLKNSMKEYHDTLESGKSEVQGWIDIMNNNTYTALQQLDAYNKLVEKYKEFKQYTPDQIKTMSQGDRDAIINQANERREKELLNRREEMFKRLREVYDTSFASDEDEDAIARAVGGDEYGEQLVNELNKIRETADDVRPHIMQLYNDAINANKEYAKTLAQANTGKSLQEFVRVNPENLHIEDLEKYNSLLERVMNATTDDLSLSHGSGKGKGIYDDLLEQLKDFEKQKKDLDKAILGETDANKRAVLTSQREDLVNAISFFKSITDAQQQALKDGSSVAIWGVATAIEEYRNAMASLSVTDDTAIAIGDAYQKTIDALAECSQEYMNNGKVSEETANKAKKAVDDEVEHIEKKIKELEEQLKDPKLSEAKKQQIRVDLANAKETLRDVKGLLNDVKTAIKNNGHFRVVIDFIRRFTDEKDGNKKEVNQKGTYEYTSAKTGKKEKLDYNSYSERIEEKNGKTIKHTTYHTDSGNKTISQDITNTQSQRARKAVERGSQAASNKVEDNKEEEAKQKELDEKEKKKLENEQKKRLQEAKKKADYEEYVRSQEKKKRREEIDLIRETDQQAINEMQDGSDKKLAQINLDFQKRKDATERWYEDLRETNYKNAKDAFYKDPKNENKLFKEDFNSDKFAPTESQNILYSQRKETDNAVYFREIDKLTNAYQTQSQKQREEVKKLTQDEATLQRLIAENLELKAKGEPYDQDFINMLEERLKRLREAKAELGQDILAKYDIEAAKSKAVKPFDEEIAKLDALKEDAIKAKDVNRANEIEAAISEATKQRYKAVVDVDFEFFKKDPKYSMAFDDLSNVTTETLQDISKQFDTFIKNGIAQGLDPTQLTSFFDTYNSLLDEIMERDPFAALRLSSEQMVKAENRLAEAKAKHLKITKQGEKVYKTITNAEGKQIKVEMTEKEVLEELAQAENDYAKAANVHKKAVDAACEAIDDLADAISGIGDAVGGMEGEILKCISQTMTFTTSTIEGITKLSEISSKSITATMKAIESASVILAIVGAAIQLMQAMSSLVKDEHEVYERLAEKQKQVNSLIETINNYKRAVVEAQIAENSWFASTGLSSLRDEWKKNQAVATQYFSKLNEQQATYVNESGSGWLTKSVKFITDATNKILTLPSELITKGLDAIGVVDYDSGISKVLRGMNGVIADYAMAGGQTLANGITAGLEASSGGNFFDALKERGFGGIDDLTTLIMGDKEEIVASMGEIMGAFDAFDPSVLEGVTESLARNKDNVEGMTRAYENLRIETKKASKGFLGTGIGGHAQETADLREWIKENMNADLFDEQGLVDLKVAESVLDKYGDKLVGETKATLEELVELRKEYDEFLESVRDYVSDMFSPLVDNMTNAFFDWLATGKDVMDSFKAYATDTFKGIAQEIIKTNLMKMVFDGYEDELEEITKQWSKGEINEKEYTKRIMQATDKVMDNAEEAIPKTQELLTYIDEQFKARGIDISGNSTSQNTTSASIQNISQDTGNAIEGRLTAIQVAVENILMTETSMLDVPLSRISQGILDSLNMSKDLYLVADETRNYIVMSYLELQQINENTASMAKTLTSVNANMEEVKKNTKKL